MLDTCFYCGEDIYQSDEICSKGFGQAHIECAEREDPEELDYITLTKKGQANAIRKPPPRSKAKRH
jgi:hypothetical protein